MSDSGIEITPGVVRYVESGREVLDELRVLVAEDPTNLPVEPLDIPDPKVRVIGATDLRSCELGLDEDTVLKELGLRNIFDAMITGLRLKAGNTRKSGLIIARFNRPVVEEISNDRREILDVLGHSKDPKPNWRPAIPLLSFEGVCDSGARDLVRQIGTKACKNGRRINLSRPVRG